MTHITAADLDTDASAAKAIAEMTTAERARLRDLALAEREGALEIAAADFSGWSEPRKAAYREERHAKLVALLVAAFRPFGCLERAHFDRVVA